MSKVVKRHFFEFFHNYVWDALFGLEGLLIFFFWTRWQARREASGPKGDLQPPPDGSPVIA